MATITMAEWLKTEGPNAPKLRRGIARKFYDGSALLKAGFPFDTSGEAGEAYAQEASLPSSTARAVGEEYTASHGTTDLGYEPKKIYGGRSTFDSFQVRHGIGSRGRTDGARAEGMAKNFDRDVFVGDAGSDPRVINGLVNRLSGDQAYAPGAGAMTITRLLEAKRRCKGANVIAMGEIQANHLIIASMDTDVGGQIERTKDEMGVEVTRIVGLNVVPLKEDADDTAILGYTEAGTSTSAYVMAWDLDKLHGTQTSFPEATDAGINDGGTQYNTVVEWFVSIVLGHDKCAVRYSGITNAALTL